MLWYIQKDQGAPWYKLVTTPDITPDKLGEGHRLHSIFGALQEKHCHLKLKNIYDKIEQYYSFQRNDPQEFTGLRTIGILTRMLQTGLYVPETS